MSKPPEVVSMMDGTTPSLTVSRPPGFIISRLTAALFFTGFVLSLLFVALLAYALAPCHGLGMGRTRVLSPGGSALTAGWRRASTDVRLPRSILPHSYEVRLVPFIWEGNFTFAGHVDIIVNVTHPTRNITLHVCEIEVHEASVSLFGLQAESPIRVTDVRNDSVRQFLIVSLGEELKAGEQYRLAIRYTGQLNDVLQGFYRSSYTVNNTKRWIATTQFQSTDARRAFPCFDEPGLKAKFTMHLARPYTMTAISNMPKISTTPADFPDLPNYEWDHFMESVPMSTYLVAFTISDFEKMSDGRFSVYARHDALAQARYSLEIGPKILKHYEQYYKIKFPLPKLDMIALPDFSAGAMENWGLITYSSSFQATEKRSNIEVQNTSGNSSKTEMFSHDQLLINQQLCQHVQLSTQHFLQTFRHLVLYSLAEQAKLNLTSLHFLRMHTPNSLFNIDNLKCALSVIESWEKLVDDPLTGPSIIKESTMLYQDGISTNKHKMRVATVISHELAHQWFGNLVTPSWWSDLWLNEGFATYVECLGVDAVEPSWQKLEQFVTEDLQNVFLLDAYKSSHPISVNVNHPNEIDDIFDSISYEKSAAVIRMMDNFLTTDVFKSGLTKYLNEKAYQSATQDDLWQALTDEAHKAGKLPEDVTVKEIMDTWTLQTGFPLVTVKRNYDDGTAEISQKRFIVGNFSQDNDKSSWWIPLTFTTSQELEFENTTPSQWMRKERSIRLEDPRLSLSKRDWVLFNIKETGFYRVNYDTENWQNIIRQLTDSDGFKRIGTINRAQLVDDALNLARASVINYTLALDVTSYLKLELDYFPWKSAFTAFDYLDNMLCKTGGYDKFKAYLLQLVAKLYEDVGFMDNITDSQLRVFKRVDVLKWACTLGHEDCVRNAVTQFQNWRISPYPDRNNPISPNLKATVYCTALQVGGQIEWDFAWQRFLKANVGSEKNLLLNAMGCSREPWILSRYINWAVTPDSGIRKQDATTVFAAVSSNVIGQPLAFNFLRENWPYLKDYFGSSMFTLNTLIRLSTTRMNTDFELKALKEFAIERKEDLESASKVVDQVLENAEGNVNWMRINYKPIIEWLTSATGGRSSQKLVKRLS